MDRNWDWEDIGREMKADEEKRIARKKAEQAKRVEREKAAAVYEHTAVSTDSRVVRQEAAQAHFDSKSANMEANRTTRSVNAKSHHNLTVNKDKAVRTLKPEENKEKMEIAANQDQKGLSEAAETKDMNKTGSSDSLAEEDKKGKEATEAASAAESEKTAEEHRRERNEKYYQDARRNKKVSSTNGGKKKRKKKRKKKSKLFRNLLLLYIAVLTVLAVLAIRDVYNTMVEMRDNDPITIVREHMQNLTDEELSGLFESNPAYEDPGIALRNIRDYVNSGELIVKKAGKNEYEVRKDGDELFVATLRELEAKSKYLILNYELLEFESLQPATDGELYHYEITAPSSYQITVNGRDIAAPVKTVPLDGFADVKNYVTLPATNTYIVDHLTKEPDIRIMENGTDISFTLAEKMDLAEEYKLSHTFGSMEEAGIDFDALGFAEKWDLFMTDDLPGGTHGYYELSPYFIEDTAMQKKAHQWATDIDITLTSAHTLGDPPLSNQQITDVVVYDENTVSYEAYIEKTMIITKTGETKLEKFASTIYLVRYEDEWKVANIRGDVSSD